jgi:toxin CptA
MSIAVSADIKPSRLLRGALAVYATASAGAAVALASSSASVYLPSLVAAACLLAALAAGRAAAVSGTTRRIDISGLGEIRLTVQQSMGEAAPREPVQLLPGSTVWPILLMLLLRDPGNGALTVLTILPDSVSHEQFRKLAVCIRAIAGRDNKFLDKNKIH